MWSSGAARNQTVQHWPRSSANAAGSTLDRGQPSSADVRTTTPGSYEVIEGYAMDAFAQAKIAATNKELADERAFVAEMIA